MCEAVCMWERELEWIYDTTGEAEWRCLHVVVCACGVCVWRHMCAHGGQKSMSGIFLNCSPSYFEITSNYIHMHVCVGTYVLRCMYRVQRTTYRSQFSPSYMFFLKIELMSSVLMANALTYWAISPALCLHFLGWQASKFQGCSCLPL